MADDAQAAEGGGTWRDRKRQIRERYYATLKTIGSGGETQVTPPERHGVVVTPAVSDLDPSAWGVAPETPSSGTSATATAPTATATASPASTTPAASTSSSSGPSMAWMVAPIGYVEQPSMRTIVAPNGSLEPGLPPWVHASLVALATARNESIPDTVLQIAEFFVEAEDERAEGPLLDALEFYCANYIGPAVMAAR